ncbi:MAG TPA: MBL fold metallo-hydrolase [Terriglobales bacterium]|nr:MBL fold metallo-hydrolase [Terriglobales bacterium]
MLNITLRHKARQFSKLVRSSATEPRSGTVHRPVLADNDDLGITFIGHSGFFLQMGGKNIVIDPNFARWLFILKRLRKPGVHIRHLPSIDYVLVTHAHFDHLHRPSLRRIARRTKRITGVAPVIIVPRHLYDLVADLKFRNVIELDWWQDYSADGLTITHVPARHWGARMIHDTHRGFGGYVLRSGEHSIYHAGDTAYFNGFREIGSRLRPKIALLPIGAYHPESFRAVHTSPEDAMQAFVDLGSRWMVPMHYGTFRLSHEPMEEPVQRLQAAAAAAGISEKVRVLEEGITKFF